uniref:C3H1-type domain-containing protein n=1 Tax=Cannabis sativa TaxID=3483 RepID=A0A803R7B8_CANSA
MEYEGGRKRARFDTSFHGNGGGFKKSKPEMETFTPGIGSKSKPCTKFFSTSGCPFGENCHFLHYVPGGLKVVSQLINAGGSPALPPPNRNPVVPPSYPDGLSSSCQDPLCATSLAQEKAVNSVKNAISLTGNGSLASQHYHHTMITAAAGWVVGWNRLHLLTVLQPVLDYHLQPKLVSILLLPEPLSGKME